MNTPQAVIFDLGKVLVDFDYTIAVRKIAECVPGGRPKVESALVGSQLLLQYERGDIETNRFFSEVCRATGFQGTLEDFAPRFSDIFTVIPEMVRLQEELRDHQVPTFIFSNTNPLQIAHIRRAFPFFANFNGYILSFEHHTMKPEAALYEVVERISGLRGPSLLYLDDRPENVEAGKRRGWQTIVHHDATTTRAQMADCGLPLHD